MSLLDAVAWNADGLVVATLQDRASGTVLMQAWMNREALTRTMETGHATFWSRSRSRLWVKGESSGHTQAVQELRLDCDGDALLLLVDPEGPACHTGEFSCFFRRAQDGDWVSSAPPQPGVLPALAARIEARKGASPDASYVASLLARGRARIAQKLGEEAVEAVIAAMGSESRELTGELADLWFHSLVLLADAGLGPDDVLAELYRRVGRSGLAEKAARRQGEE